jgi:membrane protein
VTRGKPSGVTIARVGGVIAKLMEWAEQTLPVRCLRRFLAINGTTLALVVAAQAFTAFIPLLIVVASLSPAGDSAGLAGQLVERFHLTGDAATAVRTLFTRPPESGGSLTAIGVVLLVVSGLNLSRALQRAYEAAWGLPRSVRGTLNGVVALTILLTQIVLLALLAGLLRGVPAGSVATLIIRSGLTVLVWLVLQHLLLAGRISWSLLLPGAIFAAIGQQVLSLFSAFWMPHQIERNAQRYGVIGVTFALLSWLTAVALLLVGAAVVSAELGLSRQRHLDQHQLAEQAEEASAEEAADEAPDGPAPAEQGPGEQAAPTDRSPRGPP